MSLLFVIFSLPLLFFRACKIKQNCQQPDSHQDSLPPVRFSITDPVPVFNEYGIKILLISGKKPGLLQSVFYVQSAIVEYSTEVE